MIFSISLILLLLNGSDVFSVGDKNPSKPLSCPAQDPDSPPEKTCSANQGDKIGGENPCDTPFVYNAVEDRCVDPCEFEAETVCAYPE